MILALLAQALLEEGFDGAKALQRWSLEEGARTGREPASTARIEDGALVLEADRSTRVWLSVEREVALEGARWIRVSARARAENVDPAEARFANCNLYARFPKGPVATTRILTGTTEWATYARRIEVPEGARTVVVGCFLSMPGRARFDDVRVDAVNPPKWNEGKAGRYVFRWFPGDDVPEKARRYNEESYRIVREFLGVEGPKEVFYFKYPDLDVKEEYTSHRGNAFATGNEIHTIWATDRHEIVHVLAREWGDPPPLLGEGLAVFLSGNWQGKPVERAAAEILSAGKWIALADLLDAREFRRRDDLVTYAIAGAFVKWITETLGREKLKALYGAVKPGSGLREFERALGMTLQEADAKVRTGIEGK
ncbi:MAG: hypothetical protein HYY17_10375 [Planctomycetes bacterium]|nr:hypothetical protein [Planctomycetota bacterium]